MFQKAIRREFQRCIDRELEETQFNLCRELYTRAFRDKLASIKENSYEVFKLVDKIFQDMMVDLIKNDPEIKAMFKEAFKESIERVFQVEETHN